MVICGAILQLIKAGLSLVESVQPIQVESFRRKRKIDRLNEKHKMVTCTDNLKINIRWILIGWKHKMTQLDKQLIIHVILIIFQNTSELENCQAQLSQAPALLAEFFLSKLGIQMNEFVFVFHNIRHLLTQV